MFQCKQLSPYFITTLITNRSFKRMQLPLSVDRDSFRLSELFDERDESVKRMLQRLIKTAHAAEQQVSICGQAPRNYPDFAAFLVLSRSEN